MTSTLECYIGRAKWARSFVAIKFQFGGFLLLTLFRTHRIAAMSQNLETNISVNAVVFDLRLTNSHGFSLIAL